MLERQTHRGLGSGVRRYSKHGGLDPVQKPKPLASVTIKNTDIGLYRGYRGRECLWARRPQRGHCPESDQVAPGEP